MKYEALRGAKKYTKARLWKKRWYRVMSFLAAVVVFCTTYALILPAVTASSKPLKGDDAYVTEFSVTEITDGTTPFDGNDNAGNDSDVKNGIVRTFDTVTYTINVAYDAYDGSAFTDARVWLEFELPVDKSQAEFNLAAMGWLENPDVKTYTRIIDGVETKYQVLTGYKHLFTNDNSNVVPGNFSNVVTVNIKMMKNRDTIAPIFSAATVAVRSAFCHITTSFLQHNTIPHNLYNIQRILTVGSSVFTYSARSYFHNRSARDGYRVPPSSVRFWNEAYCLPDCVIFHHGHCSSG